jgi:glycyl-tRNA synthetase
VVQPPPAATAPTAFAEVSAPQTALLEVGTEELPAAEVTRAAQALGTALAALLDGTRLARGPIRTFATPRRIAALIDAVAPREPAAERTVRGPRVSAAFDAEGRPTKAALGFARGQGLDDDAGLGRVSADGVDYVAVIRTDPGRGAVEVLSEVFGRAVAELRADTNMRWSDPALSYVRPIRWLLALLGDAAVPVAVSALASGRTTRVHRTAEVPVIEVARAEGYRDLLAAHGVTIDPAARREQIIAGALQLASGVGGTVDADGEAALIDEVTNLVEQPDPVLGGFADRYLELPAEILTTVMRKHQRYLPVRDAAGALLPYFVAVANGPCDHDVVRAGNEAVLRARYEDAAFFWRADLQTTPETMHQRLAKLAFEQRLGSMGDRADRIGAIARALALPGQAGAAEPLVALGDQDRRTLERAAQLAKFDLASQMVIELTSLAGVMAGEYAARSGEPAPVAQALSDLELPRSSGGPLPAALPGAVLALADRLDLLAGLFAVGISPTGSSDPFGLRRAALGATAILRGWPALEPVTLTAGLAAAADQLRGQGIEVPEAALAEAREFVVRRLEQQLLDAGADYRHVAAVLPLADAPAAADQALAELAKLADRPEFADLATALQRVRRIVPAGTAPDYRPERLSEPAEEALHRALQRVRAALGPGRPSLAEFAEKAAPLTGPINAFFDEILVMTDDPAQREARLGLLAAIRDLAAPVLDWAALGPLRPQ